MLRRSRDKKIKPDTSTDRRRSYRWLEDLNQFTALRGDPQRCIHIGDRESDIYELFCTAADVDTHFLVRTCVDRLVGDRGHDCAGNGRSTVNRIAPCPDIWR